MNPVYGFALETTKCQHVCVYRLSYCTNIALAQLIVIVSLCAPDHFAFGVFFHISFDTSRCIYCEAREV